MAGVRRSRRVRSRRLALVSAGLLLAGLIEALPGTAGASPPQPGGDDVATWQPGWSWTYNTTLVANTSAADVTLNETETYTVANPPIVSKDGYTDAYQVNISGTISSCSGTADGFSISNCSGSASGTAWYEAGDLALIEEDQSQTINGKVEGFIGINATFNIALTGSPAVALTDFRLHNSDSWLIASTVTESGNYNYSSSVASGSGPIDGSQPINATANVATTTVNEPIANGIPVDSVTGNDNANGVSITADWAPRYNNLAFLNLDMTSSGIDLTQNLAAASTPAPSPSVSENLSSATSCAGGPITVSGAVSNGLPGQNVTVTTDEEPADPGSLPTVSTTTAAGGSYTAVVTAPPFADGLQKPGVRGAWGILVSSGSARSVVTLEVTPQDCTSVAYTGAAAGPQGGAVTVSATVTDLATGGPASGVPVTFSLSSQSATATGTTGSNGQASATLPIAGPPTNAQLTASAGATASTTGSSTVVPFTVQKDASQVGLTSSEPEATVNDPVTFTAQVSANGPQVAAPTGTVQFFVNSAPLGSPVTISPTGSATSQADSVLPEGASNITATYSGDANFNGSTGAFTQEVHPPLTPTVTGLSATPTSSVFGQPVSLTATVSASSGTPDGQVTFFDGSTNLGSAFLDQTPGNDQASLSASGLAPGNHNLTAVYDGDNFVTFDGSTSAPVAVSVAPDSTSTSVVLSSPATTPVSGQGLTFDVSVGGNPPGAGVPTGTVQLSIDGTPVGSATLSNGTASIPVGGLTAGSHAVNASYGGDPNFSASTGGLNQTVDRAQTATTVEASPSQSVTGEAVTITATVSPVTPGAGDPTGLVTFFDGTTPVGSAALVSTPNGDQATIGLSNLPAGDDSLTASYPGDGNFLASTSPPFIQTVTQAPPTVGTTTALSTPTNPSVFGQPVSYTATVVAADGSTPAGTVQFSVDGANVGGPVPLDGNGQADSGPIRSMTAGGHTVIAAYSGATTPTEQYSVSGAVLTQTVREATTSASLSVSPQPLPYGQPVTFGVTLSAVSPGDGIPAGSVQFLVDGQDLGNPVPVSGGSASLQDTAALNPGAHEVSVISSGDPNFAGTSAASGFQVALVSTTTTLTVTPTSATFGQPVTMTATVSASATGPGTPTGSVSFLDGSTLLGTIPLAVTGGGEQAVLTTTSLPAGPHSVTASYSGDSNYAASSSPPVAVTIARLATALTTQGAVVQAQITVALSGTNVVLHLIQGPQATLTAGGQPLAGQPLVFQSGSTVLCTATTGANGTASCAPTVPGLAAMVLNKGYTVSYAGTANYQPSSAPGSVVVLNVTH